MRTFGAGLLVSVVIAAPAAAQGRGGLYEPFPEPEATEELRDFVGELPGGGKRLQSALTTRELDSGTFTAPRALRASPETQASRRAGLGESAGFLDGWPVTLAVLLGALGLAVAVARRTA
jgi:hypothetical protein